MAGTPTRSYRQGSARSGTPRKAEDEPMQALPRSFSRPCTPRGGQVLCVQQPLQSLNFLAGPGRRAESLPVMPQRFAQAPAAQAFVPSCVAQDWAPMTVVSPRSDLQAGFEAGFDVSHAAAVESCRILAEASRNAQFHCASEVARKTEMRLSDEVRRTQEVDMQLQAENARLQEELKQLQTNERGNRLLLQEKRSLDSQALGLRDQLGKVEQERNLLVAENIRLQGAEAQVLQSMDKIRSGFKEADSLRVNRIDFDALKAEHDALRQSVDAERGAMSRLNAELRQGRDEAELRVSQAAAQAEALSLLSMEREQELEAVRQQLLAVKSERDLSLSNMDRTKIFSSKQEQTISILEQNLQEQRGTAQLLQTEVLALRDEMRQNSLKSNHEHEQTMSSFTQNLEEERGTAKLLQTEVNALRDELEQADLRRSTQEEEMRLQLKVACVERDQLQSDIVHVKNASDQREASIAELRRALEEERHNVQECKAEINIVKAQCTVDLAELETQRGGSIAVLRQSLDEERSATRLVETELEDMRQKLDLMESEKEQVTRAEERRRSSDAQIASQLKAVIYERDQLLGDVGHLKKAGEQREESIAALRHNVQECNAEVKIAKAQHDVDVAELDTLGQDMLRLKSAATQREESIMLLRSATRLAEEELEDVRRQLLLVEGERDQLLGDVGHLKKAGDQRDESITSLRRDANTQREESIAKTILLGQSLDEERGVTRMAQQEMEGVRRQLLLVESERDQLLGDIGHLKNAGAQREESINSLRQDAHNAQSERDQLIGDVGHLKKAGDQRDESISSLRQALEVERKNSQELTSEIRAMRTQHQADLAKFVSDGWDASNETLQLKSASAQKDETIVHKDREIASLREDLQRRARAQSLSSKQDEKTQLQLKAITMKRDQLEMDMTHVKSAGDQREQTIASLRKALEEAPRRSSASSLKFKEGDRVKVKKIGTHTGELGVVTDPCWHDKLVKVELDSGNRDVKTYMPSELEAVQEEGMTSIASVNSRNSLSYSRNGTMDFGALEPATKVTFASGSKRISSEPMSNMERESLFSTNSLAFTINKDPDINRRSVSSVDSNELESTINTKAMIPIRSLDSDQIDFTINTQDAVGESLDTIKISIDLTEDEDYVASRTNLIASSMRSSGPATERVLPPGSPRRVTSPKVLTGSGLSMQEGPIGLASSGGTNGRKTSPDLFNSDDEL